MQQSQALTQTPISYVLRRSSICIAKSHPLEHADQGQLPLPSSWTCYSIQDLESRSSVADGWKLLSPAVWPYVKVIRDNRNRGHQSANRVIVHSVCCDSTVVDLVGVS